MSKLSAVWDLFKAGTSVADPVKWKTHQIQTNVLAGAVLALVHFLESFNVVTLPIDADGATALAAGVLVCVNSVLTITTSDKVGLPTQDRTNLGEVSGELPKPPDSLPG